MLEVVKFVWIVLTCMVAIITASLSPFLILQVPWTEAFNGLIGGAWVLSSIWVMTGVSPLQAIQKVRENRGSDG